MSPNSRTSRLLPVLLLLIAAALFVAGCGDSDSSSDDSGSTKEETTAAATDDGSGDDGATETAADGGGDASQIDADEVAKRNDKYDSAPTEKLDPATKYVVRITTEKGPFDIVVDQKAGPIAAANFVHLVKDGYYDGIVFHRVMKDFMVQTGDPTGTGTGGPGYTLKDDPIKGGYERGVVAMANAGPDTGGSQFFIVQGTTVDQTLGPDYVIFGKVDETGMKTIDKIANVEVEASPSGEPSQPTEPIHIIKAELIEPAS